MKKLNVPRTSFKSLQEGEGSLSEQLKAKSCLYTQKTQEHF